MNSPELGMKIRELRKSKNMSLQQVGDLLSVSPQAISQYELNKRDIPGHLLIKMLLELGLKKPDVSQFILSVDDIPDEEKTTFLKFYDPFHFFTEVESKDLTERVKKMLEKAESDSLDDGKTIWESQLILGDGETVAVSIELPDPDGMSSKDSGRFILRLLFSRPQGDNKFRVICNYSIERDMDNKVSKITSQFINHPDNDIKYNLFIKSEFDHDTHLRIIRKMLEAIRVYFGEVKTDNYEMETTYTI